MANRGSGDMPHRDLRRKIGRSGQHGVHWDTLRRIGTPGIGAQVPAAVGNEDDIGHRPRIACRDKGGGNVRTPAVEFRIIAAKGTNGRVEGHDPDTVAEPFPHAGKRSLRLHNPFGIGGIGHRGARVQKHQRLFVPGERIYEPDYGIGKPPDKQQQRGRPERGHAHAPPSRQGWNCPQIIPGGVCTDGNGKDDHTHPANCAGRDRDVCQCQCWVHNRCASGDEGPAAVTEAAATRD